MDKENLVFVGGFAMYMHGLVNSYSDYDIVVTSLTGIDNAKEYHTNSKFSSSGKRATVSGKKNFDIFIENELPEYQLIKGLKVQTIRSMRDYYLGIFPEVSEHWKYIIEQKLKLLK